MSTSLALASAVTTGQRPANPFRQLWGLGRPLVGTILGDSITAADAANGTNYRATGAWFIKGCAATGGRVIARQYGYSGLTATGHRGQSYQNDYLQCHPDFVVYALGANDLPNTGNSWVPAAYAAYQAAVLATIADAFADGVKVVVIVKITNTGGKDATARAQSNAWLDTLPTTDPRIIVMPGFDTLISTSPFGPETGDTYDQVHPNFAGGLKLASAFADWLNPLIAGVTTWDAFLAANSPTRHVTKNASLPYQSALGGGYPLTSSESLLTGGGPNGGNGVRVQITAGDGNHIVAWKGGSTGTFTNKWYVHSLWIKANLQPSADRRDLTVITYPATFGHHQGSCNTLGGWHQYLVLNKTGTDTEMVFQTILYELLGTETNVQSTTDFGEMNLITMDALKAANGAITWRTP